MTHDTHPMSEAAGPGMLAPGTQFGAYRIVKLLGAGGMGQVYEAMHIALSKHVAIKVIVPEHASHPEVVARFLREAQATARIRHPNVVDVTDVGEFDGVPYLVMEFLEGEPLSRRIRRDGMLSAVDAVDLIVPVLAALEVAHEQGIVHRDLKPDNIFLVRERGGTRPTIVDFGISKLLDPSATDGASLTKTSLVVGTPYYMAPEQAHDSKRVDARADVYAIGVVLYEMLAGKVPFSGDSLMSILMQIAQGDYPPLGQVRADLDAGLVNAVAMAMAIAQRNRFASASDFGRALLPFASADVRARFDRELKQPTEFEAGATRAVDIGGAPTMNAVATPTAHWVNADDVSTKHDKPNASAPRKPWLVPALGAGALVLLGSGVVLAKVFLASPAPEVVRIEDSSSTTASAPPEPAPVPASAEVSGKPGLDKPGQGAPPELAPSSLPSPQSVPALRGLAPSRPSSVASAPSAEPAPSAQSASNAAANVAPAPSEHAQVRLRFSGDCAPRFDGTLLVGANASSVLVNSTRDGRMTGVVTVAACRGPGRFELGAIETAQRGVSVSVGQGMRMWTAMPNLAAQPGQALNSGFIQVERVDCDRGVLDVRFDNAVLVSPERTGTCTVNGTLRTTGSDL